MWKIVIDYDIEFAFDIYDSLQKWHWNFRELVSKESWLWQFVCENGMVKFKQEVYFKCIIAEQWDANDYKTYSRLEYRLIESALKDESELEDFLLSNIVIKENENWTR